MKGISDKDPMSFCLRRLKQKPLFSLAIWAVCTQTGLSSSRVVLWLAFVISVNCMWR